eukprot:scaffold1290_cov367-Prasinococcus_capsulatus_cf.AAC.13
MGQDESSSPSSSTMMPLGRAPPPPSPAAASVSSPRPSGAQPRPLGARAGAWGRSMPREGATCLIDGWMDGADACRQANQPRRRRHHAGLPLRWLPRLVVGPGGRR